MIHYFSYKPEPGNQCVICWDPLDPLDEVQPVVAHTEPDESWMKQYFIIWHPLPSASKHPIHISCLSRWIALNTCCPQCRAPCIQPEYTRAYALKKVFRITFPIVCGMGSTLGLHHLVHDEIVAVETAKLDKHLAILRQHNLVPYKNSHLSYLDQQISLQITFIMLRFCCATVSVMPFALRGCARLAERTMGVCQLIPSRVDTTALVMLGTAIGCSMIEEFNLCSTLLFMAAVIRELVTRIF